MGVPYRDCGLDPDRLYPSVYQDDDEAFDIWNKEIGIAPEDIQIWQGGQLLGAWRWSLRSMF